VTEPDKPAQHHPDHPQPDETTSVRADVSPAKHPTLKMGRTERRVVFAVLVTALIPLIAALFMARAMVARVSAVAFQPEFGMHLDRALEVYADLARVTKQSMRHETEAISLRPGLEQAARADDRETLAVEFETALADHPTLISLGVEVAEGHIIAEKSRQRAIDPAIERTFTVRRFLGKEENGLSLVATFATSNARFAEMESAQSFVQAYHQIERDHREEYVDRTYTHAFGLLFGVLILLAMGAGLVVARPVARKIAALGAAMRPVSAGDLTVRVNVEGEDEVADLGRAFNRMLEELQRSRARIEFLRRVNEWQKIARHLAHEIKNPLMPIQLSVQECHRRYSGQDADYRRILQTTLEVVEEEVGTLRRLVGEFSSFARLPQAELIKADLGDFMREQRDHFIARTHGTEEHSTLLGRVKLNFKIPDKPLPTYLDREMLHRVLVNIVQNAAQALRDAKGKNHRGPLGTIDVSLRSEATTHIVDVDDDGPGIAESVRDVIFDPYVTTKHDGTGLGLTIVKKIIVDHGGTIDALVSPLGGARFEIHLPREGTPESLAAVDRSVRAASAEESAMS
jgi:two-component system, NtrC family, nitrogen regulation sensor histidine kinase NtrY